MTVENIPKLTGPASKLWAKVPAEFKKRLQSKGWCGECRSGITISDFTGKGVTQGSTSLIVRYWLPL